MHLERALIAIVSSFYALFLLCDLWTYSWSCWTIVSCTAKTQPTQRTRQTVIFNITYSHKYTNAHMYTHKFQRKRKLVKLRNFKFEFQTLDLQP